MSIATAARVRVAAAVVTTLMIAGCAASATTTTTTVAKVVSIASTSSSVDIGAGLQGDASLLAQQYATGLTNIAALAFDSSDQLWAATAGFTADGSDGVYVVDAAGAIPTLVIDDVTTPLGLLWIGDELLVASASKVEAYSDFDGTAFATKRTVVQFADGVGEINGLAMSSSGRIMLGISSPCNACTPSEQYSASIVSFLPDGSDLQVYASDIRAAVGLAFYPGTDMLFVTMNQRDDLGDATPGDLLTVVKAGQSWGFPDCYGQLSTTCATQPPAVATLDPHAAVSGVAIAATSFGGVTGPSAIVAEWKTGVVLSVALNAAVPAAPSTPKVLVSGITNPVAVVMGPYGALYTGDWATGILYRISSAAA